MKRKSRPRSEIARGGTAAPSQMEEEQWRAILRYGERRAREQGIGPEDVARLVEDYRAESGPDIS